MNAALVLSSWKETFHGCWPGLLLSVVVAIASAFIAEHLSDPLIENAKVVAVDHANWDTSDVMQRIVR